MDLTARAEAIYKSLMAYSDHIAWCNDRAMGDEWTQIDLGEDEDISKIEAALLEVVEERDKVWRDAWREMRWKELL